MRDILIVLSQSGTSVSKILKAITKNSFNHSSIALSEDLDEFYSFGRKYINNPLIGSFVVEHKDKGVYEKFPNTPCIVLKINVSDEQYTIIEHTINDFLKNKDLYKYDFLNAGLINTPIHIKRKYKFFCSEFVAYVLNSAGVKTPVCAEHIQPIDFLKLENSEIIYEGILQKYATFSYQS